MFKKALAHQSNATPIRSSARRQLVTAIIAQHPQLLGPSAKSDDDAINEKEIGKVIVPEGIRMGTFETSGGVEGTMYFDQDSEPLWMSFGRNSKDYIPTLSLLSLPLPYPPLPILQIHHPIPPPLLTGAPLFVPALRNLSKLWLIPDVPEGGLVSFVISEKNDLEVQYVGVGRVVAKGGVRGAVERRIQKLKDDKDVDEGKFCEVLCIKDDHLWTMGSKPDLPTFTLPVPVKGLTLPPSTSSEPSGADEGSVQDAAESMENLSVQDKPAKTPSTLSPSDISTLLSLSLLQTLSTDSSAIPNFPIPASQLYSGYILPNRPAYIPKEQREEMVIAKSEWKKLAKWMKEASKDGLIKIKDSKGEVTVQSFDANHPSIQGHNGYLTIAAEDAKAAKRAAKEAVSGDPSASSSGKEKGLVIEELWKPNGAASSFWEAAGVDKSSLHPPQVIKAVFEDYIARHSLVDTRDYRSIKLDEELGRAVGVKNPQGEVMGREEVLKRLRAGVAWSVSINGVLRKGQLQPITMAVKTRQGRKTVTIVAGLETFGIDIEDFAEELRKLCAGSASIQPLAGSSQKLNLKEIMVQGSQVKVITEALVAKGIPKRWIKEVDGGKKK